MNTTSYHIHLFRTVGVKVQNCSNKLAESSFIPRNLKNYSVNNASKHSNYLSEACKSGLTIHPFLPGNVACKHFASVRTLQDS